MRTIGSGKHPRHLVDRDEWELWIARQDRNEQIDLEAIVNEIVAELKTKEANSGAPPGA